MKYYDEEDEDENDRFLLVGDLKELLKDTPDYYRIYIEKVDDVSYEAFDLEKKEIPDESSPNEMVYKFVRGVEAVAYEDEEREGVYITAFDNN